MSISGKLEFVAEARAEYRTGPKSHRDLKVYRRAFDLAMQIHKASKSFPAEERYSLTDQIRRSSKAVNSAISEGWRRRRYKAAFINKMSEAEAEAAETQTWLEFCEACGYLEQGTAWELIDEYEKLMFTLVAIIDHADEWIIKAKPNAP